MKPTCPHCGQDMPQKLGRICGLCGDTIRRHHRWHTIASVVQHRDCKNPELLRNAPDPQAQLLEAPVR